MNYYTYWRIFFNIHSFSTPNIHKYTKIERNKKEVTIKATSLSSIRNCITRADFRLAKPEKPQFTWRK